MTMIRMLNLELEWLKEVELNFKVVNVFFPSSALRIDCPMIPISVMNILESSRLETLVM